MKLRNKKTGQLGNFVIDKDHFECVDLDYVPEYKSLAELNAEWCDAPEEPEGWWFICQKDNVYESHATNSTLRDSDADREIGNYFATKEETEAALRKLKAWKRLRGKGFVFKGWEESIIDDGTFMVACQIPEDNWDTDVVKDLDLLFGGEE